MLWCTVHVCCREEFDASKPTNYMYHGWTSSPGAKGDSSAMDPFFPTMLELKDAILSVRSPNKLAKCRCRFSLVMTGKHCE